VTLKATDSKGASASCQATVTVHDATAPVITTGPALTVNAPDQTGAIVTGAMLGTSAADNCSPVTLTRTPAGDLFPVGVTTVIWTARDAANNTSSRTQTVTVLGADNTPPVIRPVVSGTAGANGWYRSSVAVSWNVSDPESGIVSSAGCGSTTLTADTAGTVLTCSATNGARLTNSASVTIRIDKTPSNLSCGANPATLWPPNGKAVADGLRSHGGCDVGSGPGFAAVCRG
jgi:hypothetical protein